LPLSRRAVLCMTFEAVPHSQLSNSQIFKLSGSCQEI
jgi:hypothetical protein